MKIAGIAMLALVLSAPAAALAQQPQQHVTATQILGSQVGALAEQNAKLVEQVGTLQEQLAAAQAQIKKMGEASSPKGADQPK